MRKINNLLLLFLTLVVFQTISKAQCYGVTTEVFPADPQSGPYNYFGIRVTLVETYNENVTVNGYIYDEGDPNTNNPFSVTVYSGYLSAETVVNFYQTCPTCNAIVDISSILPCPDTNFVIPINEDYTDTVDGNRITVSDVYSRLSSLRRKIEIFNSNEQSIGVAYINIQSSNNEENLYDKIYNDPDNFSGSLSIEIGGQIIYSMAINDGMFTERQVPGPEYNPNLTCTFGHVHDCVAYKMETMNWVEFTICCFTAPGCYITKWLSCQWEVCHNHMEYTNPN